MVFWAAMTAFWSFMLVLERLWPSNYTGRSRVIWTAVPASATLFAILAIFNGS